MQALAIGVSQLLFVYFRTINVSHVAAKSRLGLLWSGACVHITWIVTTSLGVNAFLTENYLLIIVSWVSGLIGSDLAVSGKLSYKPKK